MGRGLAERAGTALAWRAGQLVGVQGLGLLRTLILARILVPDDFGLVAIGVTAIASLLAITDVGVAPALVQRESVGRDHYDSAWTIALARGALVSALLALAAPFVAQIFLEPRAEPIVRILALRPFFEALASIKLATLQRKLDFRALALARVPPVAIDLAIAIALAPRFGVWALVAGNLAGALAKSLISYAVAPYVPRLRFVVRAALGLVRFGRWVFARGALGMVGNMAIQMTISRRLGSDALGLYFLAGKLAYLPYEIASQVVGEVAFSLYSRLQKERDQLARAFRSVQTALWASLVPVYGTIAVLSPSIVDDLLGSKWTGTEDVIRILCIVGVIGIFGDAVGPLFLGMGRPAYQFWVGLAQTVGLVALVWPLTGEFGVAGAALTWIPANVACQLLAAALVLRALPHPFRGLFPRLFAVVGATLLGSSAAFAVDRALGGLVGLFVAAAISATIAAVALWGFDRTLKLGVLTSVTKAYPQFGPLLRRLGLES